MSKLITQRYEYVCYDDAANGANLLATPPVYPTPLDTYIANGSIAAANSFGSVNLSGSGPQALTTANNAQVVFTAPIANTTFVSISTPNAVPTIPGGAAQVVKWLVGPGQSVTFPGSWNTTGQLTAQACDANFNNLTTTFAVLCSWSI